MDVDGVEVIASLNVDNGWEFVRAWYLENRVWEDYKTSWFVDKYLLSPTGANLQLVSKKPAVFQL